MHSTRSKTKQNVVLVMKAFLILAFMSLVLIIYLKTPVREYLEHQRLLAIFQAIRDTWWSPVALIAASALGGLLALPATPFTLLIGATYTLPLAIIYNYIGLMLGAIADFLLARYLGRDFIGRAMFGERRLESFQVYPSSRTLRLL
ncbi:MAG: VTT domain-containing protein [Deltaproteobacteria bacterium]|nr:MAG: VTT domain-containing protein [Deltaproteobacteria bacterium]